MERASLPPLAFRKEIRKSAHLSLDKDSSFA
jgi:hypothetical protein